MYAETAKSNTGRLAIALLCGLAIACSVMYLSADAEEVMHETIKSSTNVYSDVGSSVGNVDTLKAGQIYTDTPKGNMRLMDYFNVVESEIATEVANRKQDIASVRAKMARDMAFNAAARATLKRDMLHKMAVNAKIARRELNKYLRKTQRKMAQVAYIQNKRNTANIARDEQTKKFVKADAAENAHNLKMSVSAWQKATNSWAKKTSARIDRLNKHVAANAAQIKENAKRARKDLDNAMHSWDKKVANFRTESKNARSRLSAQFAAQSKATKAWANNKIKAMVAQEGAQFNDIATKMAKNRHDADMALKQATMRFNAALNAQKALEQKQYEQNVADIAAAKATAAANVAKFESSFKVQLLALGSKITKQVTKVNDDVDKTAGVVRSDASRQAKVNAHVNAEMTNMIKIGNKHYAKTLKDDAALQSAIGKANSDNAKELDSMAARFNAAINKVKKDLKAQRAHAHSALLKQTGALFKQLEHNQDTQRKKNLKLAADTRRMELDAMDALRKAKKDFRTKIMNLSKVVKSNDVKADKAIKKLTGTVDKNRAKSKAGRAEIAIMENANKDELKTAIRDAIKKGEDRASAVEAKGKKMDKDTRWLMNNKLNTEISKLRMETNSGVEALALQSKEARDEMKKEMLYAIRSAANVADLALKEAVRNGEKAMKSFEEKAAKESKKEKKGRANLVADLKTYAKDVAREIDDAVATDARAQLALSTTVKKKIKKTNTDVAAYAKALGKGAKDTRAKLKGMVSATITKIAAEEKRAAVAVEKFSSEDAARQKKVLTFLRQEIMAAEKKADAKFGAAYQRLAKQREDADEQLDGGIKALNDALAKQAALTDVRFSKTVNDLEKAKKEVFGQVVQLRKDLTSSIVHTTATLKRSEEAIKDQIAIVSAEASTFRAQQAAVNRHVKSEMKRVLTLSNDRFTVSKRARGQLRRIMNDNKMAAAAEVKALTKESMVKLEKLRAHTAHMRRAMAKDLSKATEVWYDKLGAQQKADHARTTKMNAAIQAASLAAKADSDRANKMFASKIGMLTAVVASKAKSQMAGIEKLTGVVQNTNKVLKGDLANIKKSQEVIGMDLNKALMKAISIGTANAKATAQRIAEHQKKVKGYLQVELVQQVEDGADAVMNTLEGNRQKIADNYLSLKAYAIAVEDKISDEVAKGKGRALSSIGDLLMSVGAMKDLPAKKAVGLRFGTDNSAPELPQIFSGKNVSPPVSGVVAAINGLVNEYAGLCAQVRMRWPMGLGKYLMDRLEMSMGTKGVLQVDRIQGKHGNFVYINGRAVGLSNKLSDFAGLAARMSTYEDALSKLTSSLTLPHSAKKAQVYFKPPEWQGA
jgi:hypothetical protein